MSKDDLYKSFSAAPYKAFKVINKRKNITEEADLKEVQKLLIKDVTLITDLVEWQMSTDKNIRKDVEYLSATVSQNATVGRILGYKIPDAILDYNFTGTSGKSRYEMIYQEKLVRETKSWDERSKVVSGSSKKYVSRGWKRTANNTKPSDLAPKISLSSADKQFAFISNNPFQEGFIELYMVIDGEWYILHLEFDKDRFKDGYRITLPDVRVQDNKPIFNFTVAYEYVYTDISSKYVIGVDVGKTTYATAVVYNTEDQEIVHTYVMSRRSCSLKNSIDASTKQILNLRKKKKPEDAALHRKANITKKRELAVLVAQEIAYLSHIYDNALIVAEDLSWISNTMEQGRWNRGEFIKWLKHFHELNGGRVITINPRNTSQECYKCGGRVTHPVWKESYCPNCCLLLDRDVYASAVIAKKAVEKGTHKKITETRKKSKRYTHDKNKRTPITRNTLKYPGRDRTKHVETPRRDNSKNIPKRDQRFVKEEEGVTNDICSPCHNDDGTVQGDVTAMMTLDRTLKKQHETNLIYLL